MEHPKAHRIWRAIPAAMTEMICSKVTEVRSSSALLSVCQTTMINMRLLVRLSRFLYFLIQAFAPGVTSRTNLPTTSGTNTVITFKTARGGQARGEVSVAWPTRISGSSIPLVPIAAMIAAMI